MSERIYAACEDCYGVGSARAKAKHQELKGKLRHGQTSVVINALRQCGATKAVTYLLNNQYRMDYPRYRAAGLPISSARTEGACKNVIGARSKQGGMRWSLVGVTKMLALRCRYLSDELDQWCDHQRERCRANVESWSNDNYACA